MRPPGMAWVLPGWRGTVTPEAKEIPAALLAAASSLAEELVGDFFSLGARDWQRLQYQVFKLPLEEEGLASLALLEVPALLPRRRRWFYGLFLAESRILTLAQGPSLEALLLYIFTHELIHMVRFSKFWASFWMPYSLRAQEERKVHQLAREVLARLRWAALAEIILRFDQIYAQEV